MTASAGLVNILLDIPVVKTALLFFGAFASAASFGGEPPPQHGQDSGAMRQESGEPGHSPFSRGTTPVFLALNTTEVTSSINKP